MIDYDGIGESLRTLIETEVSDFKMVRYEGDERDENFTNMPYCDVVVKDSIPEVKAGNDYYVTTTYLCTVMALDLSSHKEAAKLRTGLLKLSQRAVKDNPRFDTDLETSILGPVNFANAKDDETGAFMAIATFEVVALVFVD